MRSKLSSSSGGQKQPKTAAPGAGRDPPNSSSSSAAAAPSRPAAAGGAAVGRAPSISGGSSSGGAPDQKPQLPVLSPESLQQHYAGEARGPAMTPIAQIRGAVARAGRPGAARQSRPRGAAAWAAGPLGRKGSGHRSGCIACICCGGRPASSAHLHAAACAAAEPLPSFRDVPPSEKQLLFVRKLHLCAFTFDFTNPTAHVGAARAGGAGRGQRWQGLRAVHRGAAGCGSGAGGGSAAAKQCTSWGSCRL